MPILNIFIFTIETIGKGIWVRTIFVLLILLQLLPACRSSTKHLSLAENLIEIKLAGVLANRSIEASGLTWYKDNLIILPQFPHKWDDSFDGAIFYIPKTRIDNYLIGKSTKPIVGEKLYFVAKGLDEIGKSKGSGYEAITFINDTVYVAIESVSAGKSVSYVVKGRIDFEQKKIILNSASKIEIKSKTGIHNMGEETILAFENSIYTIHEANGINVNKVPTISKLNNKLTEKTKISFPNVEYRITDATAVDLAGDFFVANYFYPGEYKKLKPNLSEEKKKEAIERILQFKITDSSVVKTGAKPIILSNPNNKNGRNWEGIVRYNSGFLLITDMFPRTILAYYR